MSAATFAQVQREAEAMAARRETPPPIARREPPWPASLAPEALHGPAGEFVRLVEPHTEADPAALLFPFLVSSGSALGRGAYYLHEDTTHATNLNVVLVGESSRGRKGTAGDRVRRLMNLVDPTWVSTRIVSGLSSGEGLIWSVRDPIYKREAMKEGGRATGELQDVLVDPGEPDKRLLCIESEFAQTLRVLQRDGNTLSPTLRSAWDSGNVRTLTKNSPATATGAHVSLIGHSTEAELHQLLAANDAHNGLANRILWVCVRRSKLLPDGGYLPDSALEPIAARLREAMVLARSRGQMVRALATREAWHAIYPELTKDLPGLLGAVTARAEAQVLRLSLLYALLDGAHEIEPAHLFAALAAWGYCAESAAHIFGDATGNPTADRILSALTSLSSQSQGLTRVEIQALFDRHKTSKELDEALNLLTLSALVKCDKRVTGGRPVTIWSLASSEREKSEVSEKGEGT